MLIRKTGINILKITVMFIIAFLFLSYTHIVVKAETTNDKPVTLTGYLIDEHCFIKKSDDPGKDTKHCLLMEPCIKGGYGIAVPQSDGTFKFYYFDGNLFTDTAKLDGTGTQKLAYDIATKTEKENHVSITVTATLSGETKASTSLADVTYPVVDVINLAETTDEELVKLLQITSSENVQNEKKVEENKNSNYITIKNISIVIVVLVVLGVVAVLILKKVKKSAE